MRIDNVYSGGGIRLTLESGEAVTVYVHTDTNHPGRVKMAVEAPESVKIEQIENRSKRRRHRRS